LRRANYSKSKGEKKSWDEKDESDWVYTMVDPVVDINTWEKANDRIFTQGKVSKKKIPRDGKYIFSGLVTCECGFKMYVSYVGDNKVMRYRCRNCNNKIEESILEDLFKMSIGKIPMRIEDKVVYVSGEIKTIKNNYSKVLKTSGGINKKVDALIELYSKKLIDEIVFEQRYAPLKKNSVDQVDKLERMRLELNELERLNDSQDEIKGNVVATEEIWDYLSYAEKMTVSRLLISEVRICGGMVNFDIALPRSMFAHCTDKHTLRDSSMRPA
jgi:site-specific DNA recombinase